MVAAPTQPQRETRRVDCTWHIHQRCIGDDRDQQRDPRGDEDVVYKVACVTASWLPRVF